MKKRLLTILLLCVMILTSSGCGCGRPAGLNVNTIMEDWVSMEEDRIAGAITVLNEDGHVTSSDETAARICAILSSLEVSRITLTPAGYRNIEPYGPFTAVYEQALTVTYDSAIMDPFNFEVAARFGRIGSEWSLIWDYNLLLPQMEGSDSVEFSVLRPARGEIFTKDRLCVAQNSYAPTLYIRPEEFTSESVAVQVLLSVTDLSSDKILEMIHSERTQLDGIAVVKVYNPQEDLSSIRAAIEGVSGIGIDESFLSPIRIYPLGENARLLCHLVGYVGSIPQDAMADYLARGYHEYDTVGISGLEASYEETLRGTEGYVLRLLGPDGTVRLTLTRKDAVNGADLTLTIDSVQQRQAEQALAETLTGDQTGCMLSLDPSTGAVTVMASYPDYDNNLFTLPSPSDSSFDQQWEEILDENSGSPLLFRCVQGRYTPGSTAKVLAAAIALDSATLDKDYIFEGTITNSTWYPDIPDWYYPGIRRHTDYTSSPNMTNALMYSDNIYFANASMMVGAERYVEYLQRFGFFEKLPFDLDVYSSQISSTRDRMTVENIKFLADLGYGQGEMLTTPLQISMIYAGIANGGDIMTPYVVDHIDRTENGVNVRLNTTVPSVWKEQILSSATLDDLLPMMRGVVESGTAASLNLNGYGIAGKTGTAETPNDRQNSWFIGFTTEGDPNLVCVTLDVKSREGSAVTPLAAVLFTAQPSTQNTDSQTAAP